MAPIASTADDTLPLAAHDTHILQAHGGGGELMGQLIRNHITSKFGRSSREALTDGAVLHCETSRIVMTTDSYVVQPLTFPGGDIGRLAVCGTVNDLAVMGGRPHGLSLGLIIEEGFELAALDRIIDSIATAAREASVDVVTGDTKVIERSGGGGLMINTAGVALLADHIDVGLSHIKPGDAVLINGTIGDHGLAVMSVRNGLEFATPIKSDAAPLADLVQTVLAAGVNVRFMRDATRGGLAGVLADIAEATELCVEVHETRIPRKASVRAAAEMLGFDLLTIANEGKIVWIVPAEQADQCVAVLRKHKYGLDAACIGHVAEEKNAPGGLVELVTESGGRRLVQRPYGEELPRIC